MAAHPFAGKDLGVTTQADVDVSVLDSLDWEPACEVRFGWTNESAKSACGEAVATADVVFDSPINGLTHKFSCDYCLSLIEDRGLLVRVRRIK